MAVRRLIDIPLNGLRVLSKPRRAAQLAANATDSPRMFATYFPGLTAMSTLATLAQEKCQWALVTLLAGPTRTPSDRRICPVSGVCERWHHRPVGG